MPEDELSAPLWFEDYSGQPRAVRSHDELWRLETAPVRWDDAAIEAPFEILLPNWKNVGTIHATALARHRCLDHPFADAIISVKRDRVPSAHQQIEAYAQLRDFLVARVSPDELAALLRAS